MKTLIAILMAVTVSGCGKATVSFTAGGTTTTVSVDTGSIGEKTALADITDCPAGMTLYPTTTGQGAFCIDNAPNGARVAHQAAAAACLTQGKELCSGPQLMRACAAGNTTAGNIYWSRSMSGTSNYAVAFALDPATCSSASYPVDLATSWTSEYYCCAN